MPTDRERITINLTVDELADLEPHRLALNEKIEKELTLAAFIHHSLSEMYGLDWPAPSRGGDKRSAEFKKSQAKAKAKPKKRKAD